MIFKPRTQAQRTTVIAFGFCIAVLGGVFFWARQMKTRVEEQKLAIVEGFLGKRNGDEIEYGFHVVDGRVVFEGRNHGSALIREKVLTPVYGADPQDVSNHRYQVSKLFSANPQTSYPAWAHGA